MKYSVLTNLAPLISNTVSSSQYRETGIARISGLGLIRYPKWKNSESWVFAGIEKILYAYRWKIFGKSTDLLVNIGFIKKTP